MTVQAWIWCVGFWFLFLLVVLMGQLCDKALGQSRECIEAWGISNEHWGEALNRETDYLSGLETLNPLDRAWVLTHVIEGGENRRASK